MNLRSILPLSLSLVAFATGCPSEEPTETLGSCADVQVRPGSFFANSDDALAELDGVVALRGDLEIRDDAITDLTPLASLRCVGGNVIVRDADSITSLEGLGALEFVGGSLSIVSNDALETTRGLGAELVVEDSLRIAQNPALASLEGLAAAKSIGGELRISENPKVEALPNMATLATVGELRIEYNDALASIAGFGASSVTQVPGRVIVVDNGLDSLAGLEGLVKTGGLEIWGEGISDFAPLANLEETTFLSVQFTSAATLDGFDKLTQVNERLWIMNNPAMMSLAGLDNVRAVDAWVRIENNPELADVSALLGVTQAAGELSVVQNASLATCAVDVLATHLTGAGMAGEIAIAGNDDNATCD